MTSAFALVRDAVAIVCEVDGTGLTASTTFSELQADSLVRVGVADVVEAGLAREWSLGLHIDDASLGRMADLGEFADYVVAHASVVATA